MTIFTPNIVITKSYDFMNKFMAGDYLSNLSTADLNDTIVFLGKQNRFVYSLDYSFNFGQSDSNLIIKVVDVDGSFENDFLNETFYEKLMHTNMEKYLKFSKTASEFQEYFASILDSRLKLYVTFGVGDDLVNWADPITCTLVGADIDVANNGLRNYTYKFAPLPNAFFTPPPAKDDDDPNINNLFDFGANAVSIEHSVFDLGDINTNLRSLLKGFMSKAVNVNQGNIIVLLPEITDLMIKNNFKGKTIQVSDRGAAAAGQTKFIDVIEEEYVSIFKVIFKEKNPSPTVTLFKGIDFKKAKTSVSDYFLENEKKNRQKAEKYKKELDQLNKTSTRQVSVEQTTTGSTKLVDKSLQIAKELKYVRSEINKILPKLDSLSIQDPEYSEYNQKYEELLKKEKELNDLQESVKTANIDAELEKRNLQGNLQGKIIGNKLKAGLNSFANTIANNLPSNIPKLQFQVPDSYKLTIRSSIFRGNYSKLTPTPDVRQAITDVFTGINNLHKGGEGYVTECIAFETNLRWLKFFKEFGLIEDEKSPCLVIGDRQLVLDYLYCNQTPINDINKIVPTNTLDSKDPAYKILTSNEYKQGIIDIVRRKKISSSFGETLFIDELSLENDVTRKAVSELKSKALEADIPIFINNFRNANVLSYSLKNTENYLSVTTQSVRDNRLKYLYGQLDDPTVTKILEKYGISTASNAPTQTGILSPVQLAEIYFNNTLSNLNKNVKDVRYQKIPKSDISGLSELMFSNKQSSVWDFTDTPSRKLIAEQFGVFDQNIGEDKPIDKSIFKGLILTNSSDSVSYLNLAMQAYLRDNVKGIKGEDLAAVAEFIILLNASNDANDMGSISFSPGLNLPGNKFILSRINEYAKRFSVEMSVKTLPYFHLSELRTINKPALFFSKRISPINNSIDQFDFFSGEYRITGFRHVITTSECYSEFMLTKYGATDDLIKK